MRLYVRRRVAVMMRWGIGTRRRVPAFLAVLIVPVLSLAALSHASGGPRSERLKPVPCPDRRYLVEGWPLLPGDAAPQAIVVSGKQVSLGTLCAPTTGKIAAKRRGTRVK